MTGSRWPAHAIGTAAAFATAVLLLVGLATPASAHPFGAPLVARVVVDGTSVAVTWRAAEDDLVALGHHLGVFEDAAADGVSTGAQLLLNSPRTVAYLQQHVQVLQHGSNCHGASTRMDGLAGAGAVLRYNCPAAGTPVEVRITALTDIHPAYRTLVITDGSATPHRSLLSVATPELTLSPAGAAAAADLATPLNIMGGVDQMLLNALQSPALALLGMLTAFAVGAVHALAPGHGKTLTAAYLVGSGAGRRQAIGLGAAVAVMHTLSVLVVALVWHLAAEALDLAVLTASLQLLAALVSVGVGLVLLRRKRSHHHHALPPGERAWSWRGLGAVAVSGGILPSPTAFLVLTTGLLTGRAMIALALVALFAIGLAVSLSVVGCATLRGQQFLAGPRRAVPVLRIAARLPGLAAVAVVAVGGLASLLSLQHLLAVLS